jgi:hypothetical protein
MAVRISNDQDEPERSCTNHTEHDKPIIPSEARSNQSSYHAQANDDQNQQDDYTVDGEFDFDITQDRLKNLGRRVDCGRHDGDTKNTPQNATKSTRSTSKFMGHPEYICTSGKGKKCSPILPYIKRTLYGPAGGPVDHFAPQIRSAGGRTCISLGLANGNLAVSRMGAL